MRLTPHITRTILLIATLLAAVGPLSAQQSQKIAEQQRVIANLERRIADDDRKIKNLKSSKSTTQQRVRLLTRQIESRNQLLNANRRQIVLPAASQHNSNRQRLNMPSWCVSPTATIDTTTISHTSSRRSHSLMPFVASRFCVMWRLCVAIKSRRSTA